MAVVKIADIKEKLQQVIDELGDHYGDIHGLRVTIKMEETVEGPLAIIDKIFINSLQETEI